MSVQSLGKALCSIAVKTVAGLIAYVSYVIVSSAYRALAGGLTATHLDLDEDDEEEEK